MINEKRTLDDFGYISEDLSHGSAKQIWRICEQCGGERVITFKNYTPLCRSCASKNISPEARRKIAFASSHLSDDTRAKMSKSKTGKNNQMYGKSPSEEIRKNLSIANSGKNNPNYGKSPSEETRRKRSATRQGLEYDEWESYAVNSPYCPLFNESCRESNREKYNHQCFICGCNESKNITSTEKQRKLSVHHVDMNKQQGCDEHMWKLIPVCIKCHNKLHTKHMESCIEYILKFDEV